MNANADRARSAYRAGITLLLAAAVYEAVARSGAFPPALLPTLPKVADQLVIMLLDGTMLHHAASTMYRVLFGLALAVAVGLPLGILMARFRPIESFFLPLASALMPIPSLAWVPLTSSVRAPQHGGIPTFYAALFPMLLNAGRACAPSIAAQRAAGAMVPTARAVLEGDHSAPRVHHHRAPSLPRHGSRGGVEMLAASDWGLGGRLDAGIPQRRRAAALASAAEVSSSSGWCSAH